MRIIPRSESGLAPPRGNATGPFEKTCIIIHYTCSPNGILTPETEKGLMQMWQNEHEAKYSAWDILQAFSVFQSGRIYENRIWTSNSGAIYNAGGWSTKGVGIECQGDFRGDVKMSDLQYQALLYLCCSIYIRPGFKPQAGRFIFGHKELYPCRPGDVHSTDCPANLLNQFVVNGKLQNDVLASAKGKPVGAKPKEEGMYEQLLNTKEFVRLDCWRDKFNYFVTTDGNAKNLRFKLQGKLGGEATTDPQDKDGIVDHNLQDILKQDRMKVVKGSYKLTVTSDKDIGIGLREDSK